MNRAWLIPLTAVYRAGLAIKNVAYDRHWLRPKHLDSPVVSIGNLSVGGAGKTPLTIRFAQLLSAEGAAVNVLSRGYGRQSPATEEVDPTGDATHFGDEPMLIARRASVPVFVGASRYEAGLLAEAKDRRNPLSALHLLDDGFQHRQIARDVDILVVHRSDFSERLLPAGRLREPLSALRRADFIVLREEDSDLEVKVRRLGANAPIWWQRRTLIMPVMPVMPGDPVAGRVVAFCGIARPEEFFSALIARNVNLEVAIDFPDHHRYSRDDAKRLATAASEARAKAFVTTEKDAVKLDASLLQLLESVAPVRIARLETSLRDEASAVRQLQAKLAIARESG